MTFPIVTLRQIRNLQRGTKIITEQITTGAEDCLRRKGRLHQSFVRTSRIFAGVADLKAAHLSNAAVEVVVIRPAYEQPTAASSGSIGPPRASKCCLAHWNAIEVGDDALSVPANGEVAPFTGSGSLVAIEKVGMCNAIVNVAKELIAARLTCI